MRIQAFHHVLSQHFFLGFPIIFGQDEMVKSSNDVFHFSTFPSFEKQMREVKATALMGIQENPTSKLVRLALWKALMLIYDAVLVNTNCQ